MSGHNIITIGGSADGLEALKTIVGNLPSEFPAAVFIAPLLSNLASDASDEDRPAPSEMETEIEIATGETNAPEAIEKLGRPSEFTCPECHGVLRELNDNDLLRFRCRAGHAYLAESLHEQQSETEEDMLWEAFRTLEEGSALAMRIAESERDHNRAEAATRFEESAQKKEQRAMVIQRMLLEDKPSS